MIFCPMGHDQHHAVESPTSSPSACPIIFLTPFFPSHPSQIHRKPPPSIVRNTAFLANRIITPRYVASSNLDHTTHVRFRISLLNPPKVRHNCIVPLTFSYTFHNLLKKNKKNKKKVKIQGLISINNLKLETSS